MYAKYKAGTLTEEERVKWEKLRQMRRTNYQKYSAKKNADKPPKPPKKIAVEEVGRLIKKGVAVSDEDVERYEKYKTRKRNYAREYRKKRAAETAVEEVPTQKSSLEKYQAGVPLTDEEQVLLEKYRQRRNRYNREQYQKSKQDPARYKQYYGRDIPQPQNAAM